MGDITLLDVTCDVVECKESHILKVQHVLLLTDRSDMSIWIGANYCCPGLEGFLNVDGSQFNRALWADSQPYYYPGRCAKLPEGPNALMVVDADCEDRKHFICVSQRGAFTS